MLFSLKGFPEEGEFVLCTITSVQPNSVFVKLDEYSKGGMIHISEIAPGRIRNIRDYVKEGKKVVCMVLRINEEKGHIDLSLRRVNEGQKKKKVEQIKQIQKSEKIVEYVAQSHKISVKEYYEHIMKQADGQFPSLVELFNAVVNEDFDIKSLKIDHGDELEEVIRQRIKPPSVLVEGELQVKCYDPDGIEVIKQGFADLDKRITSRYLGAGRYYISVVAPDYKEAETIIDTSREEVIKVLEKKGATVSYKRLKKK